MSGLLFFTKKLLIPYIYVRHGAKVLLAPYSGDCLLDSTSLITRK
jgi:hypothetical protein